MLAISNGTELPPWDWGGRAARIAWAARPIGVLAVGYKRPALAAEVSERLAQDGVACDALGFVDRDAFLGDCCARRGSRSR